MSPSGPPVTTYCIRAEAPGRSGCPSAILVTSSSHSWERYLAIARSSLGPGARIVGPRETRRLRGRWRGSRRTRAAAGRLLSPIGRSSTTAQVRGWSLLLLEGQLRALRRLLGVQHGVGKRPGDLRGHVVARVLDLADLVAVLGLLDEVELERRPPVGHTTEDADTEMVREPNLGSSVGQGRGRARRDLEHRGLLPQGRSFFVPNTAPGHSRYADLRYVSGALDERAK